MVELFDIFDPSTLKPGESTSGLIHICDLCGKRNRWNDNWAWFGSYRDLDDGVILKSCGCRSLTYSEAGHLRVDKSLRLSGLLSETEF